MISNENYEISESDASITGGSQSPIQLDDKIHSATTANIEELSQSSVEDLKPNHEEEEEEGECFSDMDEVPQENQPGSPTKEQLEIEEGEISDEDEKMPRETEPKPLCRFVSKGQCRWGVSCRFLHPGVTDKGNYAMFDYVPAQQPIFDSMYEMPAARPRHIGKTSSDDAWERGLKSAKEMMQKSKERKEQDTDFDDKKMNIRSRDETERTKIPRKETDEFGRSHGYRVLPHDEMPRYENDRRGRSRREHWMNEKSSSNKLKSSSSNTGSSSSSSGSNRRYTRRVPKRFSSSSSQSPSPTRYGRYNRPPSPPYPPPNRSSPKYSSRRQNEGRIRSPRRMNRKRAASSSCSPTASIRKRFCPVEDDSPKKCASLQATSSDSSQSSSSVKSVVIRVNSGSNSSRRHEFRSPRREKMSRKRGASSIRSPSPDQRYKRPPSPPPKRFCPEVNGTHNGSSKRNKLPAALKPISSSETKRSSSSVRSGKNRHEVESQKRTRTHSKSKTSALRKYESSLGSSASSSSSSSDSSSSDSSSSASDSSSNTRSKKVRSRDTVLNERKTAMEKAEMSKNRSSTTKSAKAPATSKSVEREKVLKQIKAVEAKIALKKALVNKMK